MIHAYDKIYLSKAQGNMASMLDFAVYDLQEDLCEFYKKFVYSKVRSSLKEGSQQLLLENQALNLLWKCLEMTNWLQNTVLQQTELLNTGADGLWLIFSGIPIFLSEILTM